MATEPARRVKLVTVLVLVATFVAGGVTGAGFTRLLGDQQRPPPPPLPLHELDLTPEQQRRVREIHERHAPELEAIVRETFPRVRAIQERAEEEIRAVLTPEQLRRLDEIKARRPPLPPSGLPPPPPFPPPEPPPH